MKTRTGYLVKRGKTFYAVWTIAGRKFTRTTGKTDEREAKTELARIMEPFLIENDVKTLETVRAYIQGAKAELQQIDEAKHPPLTLNQGWTAYLNAANRPDSGKATLHQYEYQFEAFARWAETRPNVKLLSDVTPDTARAYAAHLAKTVSAATFNKHLTLLALVWRVLAKPGRIQTNPWMESEIARRRAVPASRRELTVDELRRICTEATGELRLLLAIGLYSGLRLGDAATLRWEETDIVQRLIRRVPLKTGRRNPRPVLVPIHPTLLAMLAETPEGKRKGFVLPGMAANYQHRRDMVTDQVQALFRQCGIQTARPGTGVEGKRAVIEAGFHSLRHSFVSLCRSANVPLSVVESIVGHSSPAMTQHYTHTGADAALAAVASLPSVIGQSPALPPADPLQAIRGRIRAIADRLTARTWKECRQELLNMTA